MNYRYYEAVIGNETNDNGDYLPTQDLGKEIYHAEAKKILPDLAKHEKRLAMRPVTEAAMLFADDKVWIAISDKATPRTYSYAKYKREVADLEEGLVRAQADTARAEAYAAASMNKRNEIATTIDLMDDKLQGFLDWVAKEFGKECGNLAEAKCLIEKQMSKLFLECYEQHTPYGLNKTTCTEVIDLAIKALKDEREMKEEALEACYKAEGETRDEQAKFHGTVQGVAAIMLEMGNVVSDMQERD